MCAGDNGGSARGLTAASARYFRLSLAEISPKTRYDENRFPAGKGKSAGHRAVKTRANLSIISRPRGTP